MNQLQWSRLLKQQDQYVHQQDKRQLQRKLRIKQMYKNQLQKMIKYHNEHMRDQKDYDRRLVSLQNQKQRKRMMSEQEQQFHKHKIKQQMARDNIKSSENRKNMAVNQNQQNKKFYMSRYKRAMTQVQEEHKSRLKHRQQEKQELARAYDSQIRLHKNRMLLQKMEDQKFTQLRDQIERKKQQNRKNFFEKVRNGYRQNPEVYEVSSALLRQRQQQRAEFLRKLASQNQQQYQVLVKMKQQNQKAQKAKQTSNYNRNYFQTKAFRQRYQSLQQIAEYDRRHKTLQQQMKYQRQKQLKEIEQKKKNLKKQLQKQIDQSHNKIYFKNRMSEKQIQLNRSQQIPASLPGLTKDYAAEKQQKILQNFLQGGSAKKIQYTY